LNLKGEVGLKEHKKVTRESAGLGAKYMVIAMVGEPFMDSAFYNRKNNAFPLIDYANEHGIYVVTFTNASLVTEKMLDVLINKGCSLIGKLWSLNSAIDDELTVVKKRWVERKGIMIPKGLALMMDAGFNRVNDGTTRLGADVIVTAKNYAGIPKVVEFLLDNGIKPIIDTMIPTGRAKVNYSALKLKPGQNAWLYKQLAPILGKDFVKDEFVGGCATKQVGLAYDNFGNVKVCCALGANVGNIRTEPISELSKKIYEYRKKLSTYEKEIGTLPACDTAEFIKDQAGLP